MASRRIDVGSVLVAVSTGAISGFFVFADTHALFISILFGFLVGSAIFFFQVIQQEHYAQWCMFACIVLAIGALFFFGYGAAFATAIIGMVAGFTVGVAVFLVLEFFHLVS